MIAANDPYNAFTTDGNRFKSDSLARVCVFYTWVHLHQARHPEHILCLVRAYCCILCSSIFVLPQGPGNSCKSRLERKLETKREEMNRQDDFELNQCIALPLMYRDSWSAWMVFVSNAGGSLARIQYVIRSIRYSCDPFVYDNEEDESGKVLSEVADTRYVIRT